MKCPLCGADSAVVETTRFDDFTIRRKRECENDCSFVTFEVSEATYKDVAYHAAHKSTNIVRRLANLQRNHALVQAYFKNQNKSALARQFNISQPRVREILQNYARFNTRLRELLVRDAQPHKNVTDRVRDAPGHGDHLVLSEGQ